WIAVFGGTALQSALIKGTKIAETVEANLEVALFETFTDLPFTPILSVSSLFLIFTLLLTSADSATYLLGIMTSRASLNPNLFVKIVWCVLITAIAIVLLLAGGLEALQTASLISALPFTVIFLIMVVSFFGMVKKQLGDKD